MGRYPNQQSSEALFESTCQQACLLCAGLPVPTQDVVEAVQAILGLMPPPKLAAAVQKLINCCPEARAALEEQVLLQDSRGTGEHWPHPHRMPKPAKI